MDAFAFILRDSRLGRRGRAAQVASSFSCGVSFFPTVTTKTKKGKKQILYFVLLEMENFENLERQVFFLHSLCCFAVRYLCVALGAFVLATCYSEMINLVVHKIIGFGSYRAGGNVS